MKKHASFCQPSLTLLGMLCCKQRRNGGKLRSMKPRESRYVKIARIAYRLAPQVLPRYSHPKSPHHFTLPQLAACVLLMFYLDLS